MKPLASIRLLSFVAVAILPSLGLRAGAEYPAMGPDIYDVHADANTQVSQALAQASSEHKRVILVFGANWCIWCRRLHATFETNPAVSQALAKGFVVVRIDVNQRHGEKRNAALNERYGNPISHGIPVLVVLDHDGKQLTTKDSGDMEEGSGHSPAKILAFLADWAPPAHP